MNCYPSRLRAGKRVNAGKKAFTLIEMLTVIIIIGIIAATAMPALKGLTQSNGMTAASRQLLDDIALARQKAINNRAKVYMVFIPPNFWSTPSTPNVNSFSQLNQISRSNAIRLSLGQYNTYALYAEHAIGDQPGQSKPRYLTRWKTLPEGVIIETNMFRPYLPASPIPEPELLGEPTFTPGRRVFEIYSFTNDIAFPFPESEINNATPYRFQLPYIVFDSQGRLISNLGHDQYIPLVKASVLPHRNVDLQADASDIADVIEPNYREVNFTNYNLIHIDWLTGRAKVEKPQIQ